jgi:ADP-ribose pyrophosphatase YjhB (NUDIX family)
MSEQQPEIQLIANLVVRRPDGRVLLVRYRDDDERWWLPGGDLEPYEHPDEPGRSWKTSAGSRSSR